MTRLSPGLRASPFTAALALSLGAASRPAQAGPTIAADLDLGTSVGRDFLAINPGYQGGPSTFGNPVPTEQGSASAERTDPHRLSKLYIVGLRVRAGWRFDLAPVFLVPEIGGGFDVERWTERLVGDPATTFPRVFGGARAGLSFPLAPTVRFEPAAYGHVGYPGYGVETDVGLALDLRLLQRLTVGAHIGYDVVTGWVTPSRAMFTVPPATLGSLTLADRWLAYGVQVGWLFW